MIPKLKLFLNNDKEKVIVFDYNKNSSSLYEWNKFVGLFRMFFNYFLIKTTSFLTLKLKVFLLRFFFKMKIGKNVGIAPDVEFDYFFPKLTIIEDNVTIGLKVNILCHEFTNTYLKFGRVFLKKNCVIGAFSNIRAGITIGENSIVSMNSFVNKDIPSNEIWGGVPAKFISKL